MATNLDYNINVNATQGVQALNNLQTKVGGLSTAFSGLKTAIAGIAFGQIITNAIKFADSIQDISDSTGIAIANIVGFGKALQNFGGGSEVAEKGILRLVTNIGAAAEGSADLQSAFGRVGVSLEDLATLSEQDILGKVILGLGGVTNKSEQAYLKSQLLGKEFRNVAVEGNALADAYATATEKAQAQAAAITAASDAVDRFEKVLGSFRTGLLSAIQPVTDLLASLNPQKVEDLAEAFGRIAIVLAGAFVYIKALGGATALIAGLGLAAGGATAAFVTFAGALGLFFAKIIIVLGALAAVNSLIKFAFGVDPIKELIDWVSKAFKSVKEFLGFKGDDASNKALDKNSQAAKDNADATTAAGNAARKVTDPFKTLREQIGGVADEYARLNALNIATINQQTSLIGGSREESELIKARTELMNKEADEIRKLSDQRGKLTKEQQQGGLGKVIDEQIAKIKQQTQIDLESTETAIRNSQDRTRAFDLEKFARQSNIDIEKELQRIQDDINKSTLGEMARKQYDILAAARDRATQEIRAEEARRGSLLTDKEKLVYYEAAKKGTDELIAAERVAFEQSRQFNTGWKQAFNEYVDNATNAAQQARDIFKKATQGMEDLIVNFAKTGRFQFKEFINGILEDLLRSQIRQAMAQIFQIGGGAQGGAGGFMGSLFAGFFANGGIIPSGKFGVVGERGPEFVSGPATVTPMSASQVVYNINAVDAPSFKAMIAADPGFIHAVATVGGRGTPTRR
jgi:lambda family phage tail tape measure protein